MTENKTYRIQNNCGDKASVWTISSFFSTVAWDDDPEDAEVYQAETIKENLEKGVWEIISNDETLPRTFKFKVVGSSSTELDVYTYEKSIVGNPKITWHELGGENVCYQFTENECRTRIEKGEWVVLPSEPENKLDISTLQLKVEIDGLKEVQEVLDDLVAQSNTTLENIKAFTTTGHDVFICDGVYKVYRKYEDTPYLCEDDEQLLQVMDALILLDNTSEE